MCGNASVPLPEAPTLGIIDRLEAGSPAIIPGLILRTLGEKGEPTRVEAEGPRLKLIVVADNDELAYPRIS